MEQHRQFNGTETKQSQWSLLTKKRFAPFFLTQFLGAFNDNLFKNALMIFIAYVGSQAALGSSDFLLNMAAGVFILPFFLFSATAGQIADKYEKSYLIQKIKQAEIYIMAGASIAFYFKNIWLLMLFLFLMGAQSAFFGPVKYSLMPQHLSSDELVGGNALVESGTFLAILFGTMLGGLLCLNIHMHLFIGLILVFIAALGYWVSRHIPKAPAYSPDLKISFNPIGQTIKTLGTARKDRSVFLSILAISWFWFLGASYLTQLPNYTKTVLHGAEDVVTLLLIVFSVGIGIGSLLCEWLSNRKIELGLVPLGALGLSIFGIDLYFAYPQNLGIELSHIAAYLGCAGSVRVLIDFFMIGVSGGLYIVPLFAYIQVKTSPKERSRIIAANNIINAIFMVMSAIIGGIFLGSLGGSIPGFYLSIALVNIIVVGYIFIVIPEFVIRFFVLILMHAVYRIRHVDLGKIPDQGAAVLVCNHVSYIDALLIAASCRRPIRFVMDQGIYKMVWLKWFFNLVKTIPIASKHKNPEVYYKAFDQIEQALASDELVCIFPEGKLTRNGEIDDFKPGIEKIIRKNPVPVIPVALRGVWGSFFSHRGGKAMQFFPKRFWSKIDILIGHPVNPKYASVQNLQEQVQSLRGLNY